MQEHPKGRDVAIRIVKRSDAEKAALKKRLHVIAEVQVDRAMFLEGQYVAPERKLDRDRPADAR